MSTERKNSDVWGYFVQQSSETSYKCRICQRILSVKQKSTYSLKRHLETKHPTWASPSSTDSSPKTNDKNVSEDTGEHSKSSVTRKVVQGTLAGFVNVHKPLKTIAKANIDKKLLKVFCNHALPFQLVEAPDFQDFVKTLCPNYNLPARKTLSNAMLDASFQDLLEEVKTNLVSVKAVALTSDGWTDINNVSFLAATVHYVHEESGQLKSHLLECGKFIERHTSQNIADWLITVQEAFNLASKVVCIVTDNASNMKNAVASLGIEHMPCFAHSLNLAVKDSIKESISQTVDRVKQIVLFYKRSSAATLKLCELQRNLNYKELKLILDVPTRWNSTFFMLERFHANKEPIISSLALLRASNTIEDNDWQIMKEAVNILRVFDTITQEISAEKNITLSKMSVIIRVLSTKLESYDLVNYTKEIKTMIKSLLENIRKRYMYLSKDVVAYASILDPRFKKKGFANDCDFNKKCASLILLMDKLIDETEDHVENTQNNESVREEIKTLDSNNFWDEFDVGSTPQVVLHARSSSKKELDNYLAEPLIHRKDDPLEWWNLEKYKYPRLYQLMLRTLCIPASSVPCERVFSKAGDVETSKRNRLTASKMSKILFIKHNQQ